MRRIVEHVVDELEGDAEIAAIGFERFLLGLGALATTAPIRLAAAKSCAVLALMTSR